MANNCKVKVQVEIEECADTTSDGPRKEDVGVFEWVISAEQARSLAASLNSFETHPNHSNTGVSLL